MIPRETKCKFCGRRILWITAQHGPQKGKRICVESGFTPYRWRKGEEKAGTGYAAPVLWTGEGWPIQCDPLPEEREAEAEGYAHRGHVCPAGTRRPTERPMSRAEKFRENQ